MKYVNKLKSGTKFIKSIFIKILPDQFNNTFSIYDGTINLFGIELKGVDTGRRFPAFVGTIPAGSDIGCFKHLFAPAVKDDEAKETDAIAVCAKLLIHRRAGGVGRKDIWDEELITFDIHFDTNAV
jgi:hypothetical protein